MSAARQPLEGRAYLRLVALGAAIGIPAALVAAALLVAVQQLEDVLWEDLPDWLGYSSAPWFLVIGLPAVGGAIVAVVRRRLPGDGGHSPLQGIGIAETAVATGPGIALAAIATLSFGAVLGPEAPLIALGSVVGVAAGPPRAARRAQPEGSVDRRILLRDRRDLRRPPCRPGSCWSRPASGWALPCCPCCFPVSWRPPSAT